MSYLILVRHGAPCLNPDDWLYGWIDIPLSRKGIEEALECALKLEHIELDLAFASNLFRTQETLSIILSGQKRTGVIIHEGTVENGGIGKVEWYSHPEKLDKSVIPIYTAVAFNERYYGKLQGMKKHEMEEKYGAEKLASWTWDLNSCLPKAESLQTVYDRVVPYFEQKVLPSVKEEKNVIICGHQGSLRALVKYIEGIPYERIMEVSFSTGELVIYRFSDGVLTRENTEMNSRVISSPGVLQVDNRDHVNL
jgi:2,3-bisphosphoglycerate-dependent phosphoglycerate mutase